MSREQLRADEKARNFEARVFIPTLNQRTRVSQDPGNTNITAEYQGDVGIYFVTIDSCLGEVLANNIPVGTTMFRRLVKAARRYL